MIRQKTNTKLCSQYHSKDINILNLLIVSKTPCIANGGYRKHIKYVEHHQQLVCNEHEKQKKLPFKFNQMIFFFCLVNNRGLESYLSESYLFKTLHAEV